MWCWYFTAHVSTCTHHSGCRSRFCSFPTADWSSGIHQDASGWRSIHRLQGDRNSWAIALNAKDFQRYIVSLLENITIYHLTHLRSFHRGRWRAGSSLAGLCRCHWLVAPAQTDHGSLWQDLRKPKPRKVPSDDSAAASLRGWLRLRAQSQAVRPSMCLWPSMKRAKSKVWRVLQTHSTVVVFRSCCLHSPDLWTVGELPCQRVRSYKLRSKGELFLFWCHSRYKFLSSVDGCFLRHECLLPFSCWQFIFLPDGCLLGAASPLSAVSWSLRRCDFTLFCATWWITEH